MARQGFSVEKWIELLDENGDRGSGIKIIKVGAAPGGDTGPQDEAGIGSLALRTDTGAIYKKIANAGATADWEEIGAADLTALSWRSELVRAATNDSLSAGNTDPSTWTDNESGITDADFAIGEYVYGDYDGTPALWEVTGISSPNITLAAASDPLADGDTFVVRKFLPDSPAGQEDEAIILYNGSGSVKLADVNWQIADAIELTSTYAATNGTIAAGESVDSAIRKLDGNQQDIQSASGLAQGDVDYGSFTGDSLADNQTSKQLFQRIEVLLEQMRGVEATGITTQATVDSVPIASVNTVKWYVEVTLDSDSTRRKAFEVFATNDGSSDVDYNRRNVLRVGTGFNSPIVVDISAGQMRLRAQSSTAGITVKARRIEVVESVL